MILSGRLGPAQLTTGEGFELDAIAAVVLGGASLMGGKGSIWGTLIGAFIIGELNNGFNLLNVSPFCQLIAKRAVIILAVLVDPTAQALGSAAVRPAALRTGRRAGRLE